MDYNSLASNDVVQKTMEALKTHGFSAESVKTKEEALERIKAIIPPGSEVMTGASTTLTQIGLDEFLKSGKHPWNNLKAKILAEKDPVKQGLLRKQAVLSEYFLGSVHGIAQTGEIVVASATGSQISSYAFSSSNIIWVAGTQKIVPTLEDAIRRVREYILPLEDQRMKKVMGPASGSFIGKLLIIEKEAPYLKRRITLILVNEILGF